MFTRRFNVYLNNPLWTNLASFSLILFFIFLSDALLSYWVPNLLEDALGSPLLMGLVFSFSSVVGFGADLVFPQLLKGYTVRKLLFAAILTATTFILCLTVGTATPSLFIFLIAMAVWGMYYEFLGFASQQYVADTIPLKMRSGGWAIIGIFKNLSYFLGPLIAGYLLIKGEYDFLIVTTTFLMIGFTIFTFTGKKHEREISVEPSEVNLWREISHWKILFTRVWPIVIISLFMGLIDATFWTTGATWTDNLSKQNTFGVLLLPAYQLPPLFIGFVVYKMKIFEGKKRLSEIFLLISGLTLCLLYFELPIAIYVLIIFLASISLSFVYPLVDAVYTDVVARMGVERKHLVGLSSSTTSLAYIISPIIAGGVANYIGEKMTFVVIGALTAVVSFILLFITPRKIRLPETQIANWED